MGKDLARSLLARSMCGCSFIRASLGFSKGTGDGFDPFLASLGKLSVMFFGGLINSHLVVQVLGSPLRDEVVIQLSAVCQSVVTCETASRIKLTWRISWLGAVVSARDKIHYHKHPSPSRGTPYRRGQKLDLGPSE